MLKLVTTIDLRHSSEDDLAYDLDRQDRRRLDDLEELPDRARVVVNVTGRHFVTGSARLALARHINRLEIQLEGDVQALRRWHDAILHPTEVFS